MEKVKCIDCKNCKSYVTGFDEYPACTCIVYCSIGHWENGTKVGLDDDIECNDFELILTPDNH